MPSASIWVRTIPGLTALGRASYPRLSLVPRCAARSQNLFTGTTYSCVATYEGSNVEIIANEQGSFTTPSFVSFNEKERLIGEAAKNQAAMNPRNTVFDVKYVFAFALAGRA